MNFLKVGILLTFYVTTSAMYADDGGYDLDKVTTAHGAVYRDILILDADSHGLLFRHRKGIAKIEFSQLSMNLQMLYQAVEEPEPVKEEGDGMVARSDLRFGEMPLPTPAVITAHNRAVVPFHALGSWFSYTQNCRQPVLWPVHWSRYHPAHALAFPACRELAVRDFLYTSNLLPKPPGICTYAIPRHGPCDFR